MIIVLGSSWQLETIDVKGIVLSQSLVRKLLLELVKRSDREKQRHQALIWRGDPSEWLELKFD